MTCDTNATFPCDLSSLYSLGALDDDERDTFEEHLLQGCARCDADLASNNDILDLMAFSAEPVEPPKALRDRLLARTSRRVETRLDETGPWRQHVLPGIETRVIDLDRSTNTAVILVRASAGAWYPSHEHGSNEEMFMIYGDLRFGERQYGEGDFIKSAAGSTHESATTVEGCMFLLRTGLDDVLRPIVLNDESDERLAG